MNEGYDDLDLGIDETEASMEIPVKAPKKSAAKAAPKMTQYVEEEAPIVPEPMIDPELDRANWPTILIEMEDGKPNYEFVSANGTMQNGAPFGHQLQVMRGVEVQVPPSIVYCLRDAVATHHVPRRDPVTGKLKMERQDRSSIPWRLIKSGKHVK